MTNEERDLISRFVARVSGAPQQGGFSGSVPATTPQLPAIDREADQFIQQEFQQHADAPYRITQTAIVQEAALAEAQNRIQRLQWELDQTRHAMQQAGSGGPAQPRGFFSSLFGGGPSAQPGSGQQGYGQQGGRPTYQPTTPPPQPQYPPNYQPGMFQRGGGSGFLGSALTTAAGVAGGMVVGNALMGAFSGHNAESGAGGGLFGGGGMGGTESASPFDTAGAAPGSDQSSGSDPWSGGGAPDNSADNSGGFDQNASVDNASFDQGDSGGDPFGGGGFDSGGGGFDDSSNI